MLTNRRRHRGSASRACPNSSNAQLLGPASLIPSQRIRPRRSPPFRNNSHRLSPPQINGERMRERVRRGAASDRGFSNAAALELPAAALLALAELGPIFAARIVGQQRARFEPVDGPRLAEQRRQRARELGGRRAAVMPERISSGGVSNDRISFTPPLQFVATTRTGPGSCPFGRTRSRRSWWNSPRCQ